MDLSPEVERFLLERISAVEEIELLLLLRRERARAWTRDALAIELRSSPSSIALRVEHLSHEGLVAIGADDALRYAATGDVDAAVDLLERVYRERPFAVMSIVLSKPSENVRLFADAFRLRPRRDK